MNKKILTLSLLLAVVPGVSMGASVYKWTDENGVTHFGDRQPTGTQSEKVNVRSGSASPAASSRPSPTERVNALEEQEQEAAEQRRQSAAEEARQKQREANCSTAQANLDVMARNARIRIEENGEQRYLTQEEIAEKRTQFEEIVAENCGPEEG
ncbi:MULTISPECIES: DUF4124 domain-containing protein [Marinobacter]|jgi:hypothetical protein|uniref:DUF4124 domain-containing protein n=1 Tax=Marinobacter TaxID=2742 RepID=UPI0011096775|nr:MULTISPECIES: DUF4124 domain-containing protein [Marinobacter]MCK2151370.1 DUF4124 domain-containing protein [Marinobacter alexandrii]